MPPKYTYFRDDEIQGLDPYLCAMLDRARGLAGTPFKISSGLRSAEHNASVGGKEDSTHLKGLAVDLVVSDSVSRYKIVGALFHAGFRRIGIYTDGHVHCDIGGDEYPQLVMWLK
jgi:uncharacterized protein YcbK (DUF882 family)